MGYSPRGCKRVGHDLATKQQQQILPLVRVPEAGYLAHTSLTKDSLEILTLET